jgi:tRNA (guanine37-N1)-methyltransferase
MPKESVCIKVPKIHGEKALVLVKRLEINDRELEINRNADSICVALTRQPEKNELAEIAAQVPDFQLATGVFQQKKRQEKTFAESLADELPPHSLASLPRALDIIGDIAIIEIPTELEIYKSLIGSAVLDTHKNVKTVLAKGGPISGTYRVRPFEIIAGEPRTSTIHKEYGCRFYVDVARAYFSPRLSHEHKRVASLVRKEETVVDLFAGVGPFSVLIAKGKKAERVYALDLNPNAIEFLKKNIRLNRVETRVFPMLGDAQQIIEQKLSGVADRVIMNLPEKALGFVDVACKAIKPSGGTVHFYGFVHLPDSIENVKNGFAKAVENSGRTVDEFLVAKNIRETAPYEWQVVLDARIL